MAISTINLPNGTEEQVITHAAIASWAGFVYQGLCALCVAMEKLLTVPDDAIKWLLNIEGYEDFAILDENKYILSFHQCKDYKKDTSMKKEFEKMEDKRSYWCQKGKCAEDVPLFFHTNMNISYSNGVSCYQYKDGNQTPDMDAIYGMLQGLVGEYCDKTCIPTASERAKNRLISRIERQVCFLHQQDKKAVNQTQQISIVNSIPFSEIVSLISDSQDDSTVDEKIRSSRFYLHLYLLERLDENPAINPDIIINFLDGVDNMKPSEQKDFIKRLFPDIDIEKGKHVSHEISNSPRINYLFAVLTRTSQELDYKPMNWVEKGVIMSPSTMGNDKDPESYCDKIAINQSLPSELLWDYDWIVGSFNKSIDDIFKTVQMIGRVKPVNNDYITKPPKTGLLSIDDKNNGRI